MKASQFSDEQIVQILQQAERDEQTIGALCRTHGIAEATFYRWRRQFGGMAVSEVQRLRELEGGSPANDRSARRLRRFRGVRALAGAFGAARLCRLRPAGFRMASSDRGGATLSHAPVPNGKLPPGRVLETIQSRQPAGGSRHRRRSSTASCRGVGLVAKPVSEQDRDQGSEAQQGHPSQRCQSQPCQHGGGVTQPSLLSRVGG